ncbi:hypothetical protein D3C85_1336740 [compost metagenome]
MDAEPPEHHRRHQRHGQRGGNRHGPRAGPEIGTLLPRRCRRLVRRDQRGRIAGARNGIGQRGCIHGATLHRHGSALGGEIDLGILDAGHRAQRTLHPAHA